jgi:hypothetical protein
VQAIPQPLSELEPGRIAGIYRQLRKSREDSKDEPGANDFYYGEMEMRRRSGPLAERSILRLYWLVSRYGLRASPIFRVTKGLVLPAVARARAV